MRRTLAIAAAALAALCISSRDVEAQIYPRYSDQDSGAQLVDSWYRHFLGRPADQTAYQTWLPQLGSGNAEAGILGSQEYFNRQGGTPQGFIAGLYNDVLGRQPAPSEVQGWVDRLQQLGWDRIAMSREFLGNAQNELNTRGAGQPAPVYQPSLVQPPVTGVVSQYFDPGFNYGPAWSAHRYDVHHFDGRRYFGGDHHDYGRRDVVRHGHR